MDLESLFFDVDGLTWHALCGGAEDAPPVVLVHGLSIASAYMAPTARLLAPEFRVFAPDLPGFGRSGKPEGALDVPQLADALARWMDVAELPRASFLANSLGCQVVSALAARHPERAERLVLLGPQVDHDADLLTLAKRLVQDGLREDPRLLLLHLRDDVRAGVRRIWQTACYAVDDSVHDWAAQIHAPTLILRGDLDPLAPRQHARRLARRMPNALMVTIRGVAHAANFSAPQAVVDASRAFLHGRHPAFPSAPHAPPLRRPPRAGRAALR